ncbi:MAG: mannose-1-phosphate guanylyltransferase [Firmicutes bacterium]|nr:mannose-1-phosphate guanylyltransferase [Bacillota bacterium]
MVFALIMAGGCGTRFWPISRTQTPKQFLSILGPATMLQSTVARLDPLVELKNIFVSTNRTYHPLVARQLPALPQENIITEPANRETAACIALAAIKLAQLDPEAVMVVLPSDHHVQDQGRFLALIQSGINLARQTNGLITLGIQPTRPETGYGYICLGERYTAADGQTYYSVNRFTEKPSIAKAREFLSTGYYLWNSGIFIWRIPVILGAFRRYLPRTFNSLQVVQSHLGTPQEAEVLEREYPTWDKVSIDYGIMEKADEVYVIPADFGWDDVGSWTALPRVLPTDAAGNLIESNHFGIDTTNSIIVAPNHLVATLGIDNLIIVVTPDAVLVCDKNRDQELKALLNRISTEYFNSELL